MENNIEVVSKEEAELRKKDKNPLWEGWIEEMPSKDYKFIIVTLFNKHRGGDFHKQFRYKV